MKNLSGKIVAITGAGSGIGRALAIKLAAAGCHLALNDYNADQLNETEEMVGRDSSSKVSTKCFDVSEREQMVEWAGEVNETFGGIQLMINNAGVALGSYAAEEVPMKDFKWLMDINFWGMVYGSRAFLPFLKKSDEAFLINISSILGLVAVAKQSPYCASKFAIRGFTESVRMEAMMEYPHVHIMSVHPGGIKTNIAKSSKWSSLDRFTEEQKEAIRKEFEKSFINTPEYAADVVIRGIKKKKKRVLIGKDAHRMWGLAKWFPVGYTGILIKTFMRQYDLESTGFIKPN